MNQAHDDRGFCVLFHRKGRDPERVDAKSHDEAIGIVRGRFPEAKIGHAEDLTNGGDRTLCWASADAAAADFDGSNAIAEIRRPFTVTFSREALGDIAEIIEIASFWPSWIVVMESSGRTPATLAGCESEAVLLPCPTYRRKS